jgi:hypothetical protein
MHTQPESADMPKPIVATWKNDKLVLPAETRDYLEALAIAAHLKLDPEEPLVRIAFADLVRDSMLHGITAEEVRARFGLSEGDLHRWWVGDAPPAELRKVVYRWLGDEAAKRGSAYLRLALRSTIDAEISLPLKADLILRFFTDDNLEDVVGLLPLPLHDEVLAWARSVYGQDDATLLRLSEPGMPEECIRAARRWFHADDVSKQGLDAMLVEARRRRAAGERAHQKARGAWDAWTDEDRETERREATGAGQDVRS